MYQIWSNTQAFHKSPSDVLGIPDDYYHEVLRFEIDNAVMVFGRYVDSKLEERDKKLNRKYKTLDDVFALRSKPSTTDHAPPKKYVGSKRLVQKNKGRNNV